jgi:tol-pal system protein YbgF
VIVSLSNSCVRRGFWLATGATLALGLGACASDEAGRRALAETTTLRTQMDEVKQREEATARELARVQSQLRGLEADAGEKTREIRAAGVELARARVLLEEARTELRERAAAPPPAPAATPAPPDVASAAAPIAPPPAPAAPPPAPAPPPPSSRPSPSAIPPHTVPVIPPRAAVAKPPVAPPASPRASVPPPVARSAQSAEQLFSAAMANLRAQEPGQAVLELTDLIARFPDHTLAPSAQLWIGEAYYQQRDYRQSLVELKRVLDGYPKSPQVADALLKTGLCHRALGDRAAARSAWEQVVREHSRSAAAGQARSLLGTGDSAARSGR